MNEKIVDFATARLRRQVRKGNVVLASQTEIAAFEPAEVDAFLDRIFGITGALVTDESRLSDFLDLGNDAGENARILARVEADFGLVVEAHDRLVDVLRRLGDPSK